MVRIDRVSCVGANERLNVADCINFLINNPRAELGVGLSPYTSKRYMWIVKLLWAATGAKCRDRIGIHVNMEWAKQISENDVPMELDIILNLFAGLRLQINLEGSGFCSQDVDIMKYVNALHFLIKKYDAKFVLPYSSQAGKNLVRQVIERSADCRKNLSVLSDRSFGQGKVARMYEPSLFSDVPHGYAGGLCDENIATELNKMVISQVPGLNVILYVDAEKKLSSPFRKVLDLDKAQTFYSAVAKWVKEYNIKLKGSNAVDTAAPPQILF